MTLYEISGLDFSPTAVWLDGDGALFMYGSQWGAVIPTGWMATLPKLLTHRTNASPKLGRGIAVSLPQRVGTAIAITNATLFDSQAGTTRPNATVLMKGDTIAAVGGNDLAVPSDARRIDGTGATVLPGLWNMHMHLDATYGPRLLAEGATTIRDPGNNLEYIARTQKQFESGELIGPRVIIAGLMDGTGKYTAPIGMTTATAEQAIAQVHAWKKAGAVQIKIYSSMNPKLVPAIVKEAHDLGMRVSGHIPAGMLAQDAVHQGFDEIQHVNFLFLNFMPDTMDKTQTPVRLTAAAERAGTIDLQSPAVKAFIALLKERDIVCDPTLATLPLREHGPRRRPGVERLWRNCRLAAAPSPAYHRDRRIAAGPRNGGQIPGFGYGLLGDGRAAASQRDSHRGGDRRFAPGIRPDSRARAVLAGRHPQRAGAAGGDDSTRAGDAHGRSLWIAGAGKGGRRDRRPRNAARADRGTAQCHHHV